MYDLRQTAGVLRSSAATLFTAATMHSFSARSLGLSGSGVATMSAMARNVAPQVRKSLAVKSAPMTSRKYALAALFVHVLKQALPGQLMAAPHQLDQTLVVDCNLVIGATLAAESEKQPAVAYELHVAILQCREAVAVVVARILVVADSKPGRVEQADDDGEHFFSRQAGQREIVAES